jgi:hypothetical protein
MAVAPRVLPRLVVVASAMVLLVAACGAHAETGLLRVLGCDGCSGSVEQGFVSPNEHISFGSVILCLSQPGSVTVTDVSLVNVEGSLRVDAFAFRPNPYVRGQPAVGAERATLVDLGFDPAAPQVVDTPCPADLGQVTPETGGSEIAVELSYTDGEVAQSRSLKVTYQDDASHRSATMSVPLGLGLCRDACPDPFMSPSP